MSERIGIQIPVWCSAICRNAFNEKCVEECSIKRDCSYFEEKPHLKLSDMPRFPLEASANMTKEERFTAVTIYLSKIVDHLQGNEDEPKIYPPMREDIYVSRNRIVSNTVKIQELLSSEQIVNPEKGDE
jgi:hypothetical protein